jgi:murein DD-endopeptidase MepM/ murein hydrolase activator NlpD
MRRTWLVVLVVGVSAGLLAPGSAPAAGVDTWLRPVAGRVVRNFRAPLTRYGAGHLGVDFAAVPGTAVRAAGAGTVVFAGVVAHARHVVLRHPGGLRTSYSFLASVRVRAGQEVRRGAVVGTTGGTGERHDGAVVHFGLRIGDTFVDPMQLFGSVGLPVRVHLAPVERAPGGLGVEPRAPAVAFAGGAGPVVLAPADPVPALLPAAVPICDGSVALRC